MAQPPETMSAAAPPQTGHRAAETMQRILEAATELFSQRNYSSVRTRDIARAAGVNIALLHRYYGTKKNLFATVLASLGNEGDEHYGRPGSRERSLHIVRDYLSADAADRERDLRLLLRSAMDAEVSDIVRDFYADKFHSLTSSLEGEDRESRLFLQFALISGIALTSFLLKDAVRGSLDVADICQRVEKMLQEIRNEQDVDKKSRAD